MPETRWLRYSDAVEAVPPGESETIERIVAAMTREGETTAARHGQAVRVSHAKSHAVLKGELRVLPGLPPHLAQGLFAASRAYPAVVRMSNVPGEILDDAVSTQRGMAIKALDVEGEMLPAHAGHRTQDFVLDSGGPNFPNADAAGFLATITGLAAATPLPQAVKTAVSAVSRAANAALGAVGAGSTTLDFFGHPPRHPLAEAYFTQAPIRLGDHVAKLGVFPVGGDQAALPDIEPSSDPDALRTSTVGWFKTRPAEFEVRVQLATTLDRTPVEDASADWPEGDTPWQPVARLALPAQDAASPPRRRFADERLRFAPGHALAAHRPLGGIMRARLRAYDAMAAWRQGRNGVERVEPASLDEIPD